MKILQINAVYGYGSTGVIVRDIENMVLDHGMEACVAYQRASGVPVKGYQIGSLLDWKLHALWTRLSGKQAYGSVGATKRLIRWMETEKPDVVHLHNLHSNYIHLNMLLRYLAKRDIATVLTLHDCWFFTGKCFHYVEDHCKKWQTECGSCPRNKKDVKSLFFDQTRRVHRDKKRYLNAIPRLTVVGCSDWICGEAKKSLLREKPIQRVCNGVDTALFAPTESDFRKRYGLEQNFVILGAAGKWLHPENRHVVQIVLDHMGEDDRLVLFACTQEQIQQFKGDSRVIALGYIRKPQEMVELYSAADVFVNLTLADTLPTVNMEAISCGTPVITYDTCGSPELVVHGETGYVVPKLDGTTLLEAIGSVKAHGIARETCRSYACRHFDKKNSYQSYFKLYYTLAGGD